MPPANPIVAIRPRSLANVLADLREALDDLDTARAALPKLEQLYDYDAEDRATEAETRFRDLQAEFDVKLAETTGLSVEDFRRAYSEALI